MQSFAQDKAGSQPAADYDIQSTYIPPEPQYDDPFAPASSSPFVINEAEATVPSTASPVPSAMNTRNAPSSTVLEFHGKLTLHLALSGFKHFWPGDVLQALLSLSRK